MKELHQDELDNINGGILPLVLAIVAADVGLISAMKSAGYW